MFSNSPYFSSPASRLFFTFKTNTQASLYRECGQISFQSWERNRIAARPKLRASLQRYGSVSVKYSITHREFKSSCSVQLKEMTQVLRLYNSTEFASRKFRFRQQQRRVIDRHAARLVRVVESKTRVDVTQSKRFVIGRRVHNAKVVFAVGKYSGASRVMKGFHGGAPLRRFLSSLKRLRQCVEVDEYFTTKRCFICRLTNVYMPWRHNLQSSERHRRMCLSYNPLGSDVYKPRFASLMSGVRKKQIHGSMQCTKCGVSHVFLSHFFRRNTDTFSLLQITSPRDWQGAANINLVLVERVVNGTLRPVHLKRPLAEGAYTYTPPTRVMTRGMTGLMGSTRPPVPFL